MAYKTWQANTLDVNCVTLQSATSTFVLVKPCSTGRTIDQELQNTYCLFQLEVHGLIQHGVYRLLQWGDNTAPGLHFQSQYVLNIYGESKEKIIPAC